MKKTAFSIFVAVLLPCVAAVAAAPVAAADTSDRAEIRALRQQIEELKKSAYHPELGEQMLVLQIRHARLWFAGEAGNWNLATFEVQELQEAFDAVVVHNPDDANLQPERLADVLPAMTRGPIADLRKAVDSKSKAAFEKAYKAVYGLTIPGQQAEAITWSVTCSSPVPKVETARKVSRRAAPKPLRSRRIFDASAGKLVNAAVYWRFDMKPGAVVKGPAIIAEHETSTILGSRWQAAINSLGQIVMEKVK